MPTQVPQIHFISLNRDWVDKMKELFASCPNVLIHEGKIQSVPKINATFVSPANSIGFMDGGIDYVLSRIMFPGIQTAVQVRIAEEGHRSGLGRAFLPIASAIWVPTSNAASCGLIAVPTMFQPHDVSGTQNAYWSFLAALALHRKAAPFTTLVATSHCCGYGAMSAEVSAVQMYSAYSDFMAGIVPVDSSVRTDCVAFPAVEDTQPNNYDNREFKNISVLDVLLKR